MLKALLLQLVFSIPTTSLLIVFLKYSQELRDFCGFDAVPDASEFTRFKQDFLPDLQSVFDRLVDLTEPICQKIDKEKASMVLFDTSGIEAWVTENNPKYANRIIKRLKAYKKSAISLIENSKSNLTDANVKAICREFNVDYIWLTTGEGEMFVDSDDDLMERIDRIMAGENEFHKKLIKWRATSLGYDDLRRLEKKIDEFLLEFSKPSDRLNGGMTPPAPAVEKETDQTVEGGARASNQ